MRDRIQHISIGILLLAAVFGLASCGSSEKSVVPVVENPFVGAAVGTDSTLEIATWNLEQFAKKGDDTVAAVVQAIGAMELDIVALQEIKNSVQFTAMREQLKGWDGSRANSAGYDINLAFLYRTDGDLVDVSVNEILVEYSREFPRRPYVLQGRYNGNPIVVINNHYICCGNGVIGEDDWDEETRRRDASLLLDSYIQANFAGMKVVVVGDFNDSLTDSPTKNVFQNFLDAPEKYQFVDMDIATGSTSGWSFPGWPSHLDHILITEPLFGAFEGRETLVQVIPLHTFMRNGLKDYDLIISDHLPVVLKLGM